MLLEFGELSSERFFSEYWRKKPLHLKGGAHHILDFTVEIPWFRALADRLERRNSTLVARDNETGFIFAQNMDVAEPRLRSVSKRYEAEFSTGHVWFDGVFATEAASIGCHYDHSDNFVLQQSGTKLWKLAPSRLVPEDEVRLRMLDRGRVGHFYMPDDCESFLVEPGDLLYIPMLWAHWGVSEDTSMSVSLVMNADPPIRRLVDGLKDVLSEHAAWYQPLPLARCTEDDSPPTDVEAQIDQLIEVLRSEKTHARLRRVWWDDVSGRRTETDRSAEPESPYGDKPPRVSGEAFGFDRRRFLEMGSDAVPSLDDLAPGIGLPVVLSAQTRRVASSFVETIEYSYGVFGEAPAWPGVLAAAERLEAEHMRSVGLVAWLWRVAESLEFTYLPDFDRYARVFGDVLEPSGRGWLDVVRPRGERLGGAVFGDSPLDASALVDRVREQWPELGEEIDALVQLILPLDPSSAVQRHHSIVTMPGMVLLSEDATVEDLVFELGRTKANIVYDILDEEGDASAVGDAYRAAWRAR